MTVGQRTIIEPSDIASIEIECPQCKTRIVQPLVSQNLIPTACASKLCGHKFFLDFAPEQKELQNALDALARYAANEKPRLVLRLQVAG